MWLAGAQALGPLSAAFPGALAGSWEEEQPEPNWSSYGMPATQMEV